MSADSLESHRGFADNHSIPFPLISDPAPHPIAGDYGVPTKGGYIMRTTIVIGKDGKVKKVFPDVSVRGHAEEVLAALRE